MNQAKLGIFITVLFHRLNRGLVLAKEITKGSKQDSKSACCFANYFLVVIVLILDHEE